MATKSGEQMFVTPFVGIGPPVRLMSQELGFDRIASLEEGARLLDPVEMRETEGMTE